MASEGTGATFWPPTTGEATGVDEAATLFVMFTLLLADVESKDEALVPIGIPTCRLDIGVGVGKDIGKTCGIPGTEAAAPAVPVIRDKEESR